MVRLPLVFERVALAVRTLNIFPPLKLEIASELSFARCDRDVGGSPLDASGLTGSVCTRDRPTSRSCASGVRAATGVAQGVRQGGVPEVA